MIGSAPLGATAHQLVTGELDLTELIGKTCDRIDSLDGQLQALVPEPGRRERLLHEAHALHAKYPDPASRPPLYGVLIGVKDIFRADGLPTRAGSNFDPKVLAGPEAASVSALRRAGALVLGKTVTTEFAYFEPGPTRNPYNLEHTPGGSSSGSAAAVAAGYCPLALGTQTIGSVIRPASYCGLVGFKPSYARISNEGLIHFSRAADHVGCFTQDVEGMILAARELCHDWDDDVVVSERPMLGVPVGKYLEQASPESLELFWGVLGRLREVGFEVEEVPMLDDIEQIAIRHRRLIAAEMAQEHTEWFRKYRSLYRPRTAELIMEGQEVTPTQLEEARQGQVDLRHLLDRQLKKAGAGLWATPATTGPAPKGLESTGSPAMSLPWTNAGLPSLTMPTGKAANGLPMGLQLVAPWMGDEGLLQAAHRYFHAKTLNP